jgi:prepilin-type N-terminal cleavage/methylation domain-containing protein
MSTAPRRAIRSGFTLVELIVVLLIIGLLIALLLPAVQSAREAARRTQSRNNLKQIGLALHNYHDTFRQFPPGGVIGGDGTPYHGWTTAIIPYIECGPLYNRVNFSIPWDDPRQVQQFMVKQPIYLDPTISTSLTADGLCEVHYAANAWLLHRNSSIAIGDLMNGTTSTLLAADANGNYAPFGYPYNWRDITTGLKASPEAFGHPVREGTWMLFADGSVEFVSHKTSPRLVALVAGPESQRPQPEATARPPGPYRLASPHFWRTINLWVDEPQQIAVAILLEPEGQRAEAICGRMEAVCSWPPSDDLSALAASAANLRELKLSGEPDRRLWAALKDLQHLQKIILATGDLSEELLATLKECPALTAIAIREAHVTGGQFSALKALPHLRSLELDWTGTPPAWPAANIRTLQRALQPVALRLSFRGEDISDREMAQLIAAGAALSQLRNVRQEHPVDALVPLNAR